MLICTHAASAVFYKTRVLGKDCTELLANMSKQRALPIFVLIGYGSDSDSKRVGRRTVNSLSEVHRRSLAPKNVGSFKKKWKLSLTNPKNPAAIRPYPIKKDYGNPLFAWELSALTVCTVFT